MPFRRLLLSLALVAVSACGREPAPSGPAPTGSVWVVEAPQGGGRLYLCGTIHILRRDDYPLAPAYESAYADTTRLVFELPPGAGTDAALGARMRELGRYGNGETLETRCGPALWQRLKQWGEKRGVPVATLNGCRPWFVSLLVTSTEYGLLGASPEMGVDRHFEARARRDDKPAEGLETVELQLQLFAGLEEKLQLAMLEQTLDEVDTLPEEYSRMIAAWKQGRLDELHEMLFREATKHPELMEIFLAKRNRTWMARLEELLKRGERAMILVGTGHFTADTGLLKLFEQRGFRVHRHLPAPAE